MSSRLPLAPWIKTIAGSAPGASGGQAKHRHVQAYALHLNELAGRRMRGFKPVVHEVSRIRRCLIDLQLQRFDDRRPESNIGC